jgi:hypothetical protein
MANTHAFGYWAINGFPCQPMKSHRATIVSDLGVTIIIERTLEDPAPIWLLNQTLLPGRDFRFP